jgi:hypothetical protein
MHARHDPPWGMSHHNLNLHLVHSEPCLASTHPTRPVIQGPYLESRTPSPSWPRHHLGHIASSFEPPSGVHRDDFHTVGHLVSLLG